MPKLYILSGPDIGRTFEVADGAKIGRGVDCAIHLRDVSVSREHARIAREENGWRVVDTGSRNGLSVGGNKVASVVLKDGEEFQVGEVLLRFRGETQLVPPARVEPDLDEIVIEEEPIAAAPVLAPGAGPARIATELERTTLATPRSRGILQYKKIEDRPGFFASDLAQQPLWIRLGAALIALALFAAIFLFAFKGTSFLKGQAAGGSGGIGSESER
ncbi:MAG: FHA domain-containing protein [Planctomycetota bacterium]